MRLGTQGAGAGRRRGGAKTEGGIWRETPEQRGPSVPARHLCPTLPRPPERGGRIALARWWGDRPADARWPPPSAARQRGRRRAIQPVVGATSPPLAAVPPACLSGWRARPSPMRRDQGTGVVCGARVAAPIVAAAGARRRLPSPRAPAPPYRAAAPSERVTSTANQRRGWGRGGRRRAAGASASRRTAVALPRPSPWPPCADPPPLPPIPPPPPLSGQGEAPPQHR